MSDPAGGRVFRASLAPITLLLTLLPCWSRTPPPRPVSPAGDEK
jgi:hypothetical protein